jgi:hypothetical protein
MEVAVMLLANIVLAAYLAARRMPGLHVPDDRWRYGLKPDLALLLFGFFGGVLLLGAAFDGVINIRKPLYLHANRYETPLTFWATGWALDACCIGLRGVGSALCTRSFGERET